jgi:hypothetical protein
MLSTPAAELSVDVSASERPYTRGMMFEIWL